MEAQPPRSNGYPPSITAGSQSWLRGSAHGLAKERGSVYSPMHSLPQDADPA
jgi:hypothetical protein